MSDGRSVLSSAKLIAACTLVSRVTGLVREVLMAQVFGLTWAQDAFNYGFQIPNLFRRLFGEGALAAVFVPSFSRTLETEGRDAAWKLLARTLALLTVTLVVLTLLIELVLLAAWLAAPPSPETQSARQLLLALTGMMLPFMISICVVALLSSILNCVGSFMPAALTPVILNLFMIGSLLWAGPLAARGLSAEAGAARQAYALAISVLLAGVVQLIFLVPVLRRRSVPLRWKLDTRDPGVRRMLALMAPAALGQGVLLLSTFLDSQVCVLLTSTGPADATATVLGLGLQYPLEQGALSAVTVAQRLYQFPLGVLVISLATAALPAFSRLASQGDWGGWTMQMRSLLRVAIFEGLLTGAAMLVLAEPIIRLLLQYGRFGPEDTPRAARVLGCYGLGMWAFCAQHIILRGFYSLGDMTTPLRIASICIPVNLALNLILVWFEPLREAAFGLSTTATSALAVVIGIAALQRRCGASLIDREGLGAILRMLAATASCIVAVVLLRGLLPAGLAADHLPRIAARMVDAVGSLAVLCVVYVAAAHALGLPEPRALLSRRR
jgi:putative peptidoglycan lipid II flippase